MKVGRTIPLDGEIRDGRHVFIVRVYYEDTDFSVLRSRIRHISARFWAGLC
jgi:hypothetical protein